MLTTAISLYERCKNYDWEKVQELQEIWHECGFKPFKHIWCSVNDQPEDMRFETRPAFNPIGG